MRSYILLCLAVIAVTLGSCGNDQATKVDLVFQANYGNDILQYDTDYTLPDGMTFNVSRSDFFISDVRLVSDDGSEVTLFDYSQVDFQNSPGGVRITTPNEIAAGNYESIVFGVGLTAENNAKSPVDFEADDLLNNSGYYWSAWTSYIFSKQEGKFDSDGDGVPDKGWVVHTGTDEIYKEITIAIDDNIDVDNNVIRLAVDHQPLFLDGGEAIEFGITHNPADKSAFEGFYNRLRTNISSVE